MAQGLVHLSCNWLGMSLNPIKGTQCFLMQDTLPSLLTLRTLWQIDVYVKSAQSLNKVKNPLNNSKDILCYIIFLTETTDCV